MVQNSQEMVEDGQNMNRIFQDMVQNGQEVVQDGQEKFRKWSENVRKWFLMASKLCHAPILFKMIQYDPSWSEMVHGSLKGSNMV